MRDAGADIVTMRGEALQPDVDAGQDGAADGEGRVDAAHHGPRMGRLPRADPRDAANA